MAFRYDKPYKTNILIDQQKIQELFNIIYQMDSQELMQYSLVNKIPLNLTLPNSGNNLIHEVLLNNDSLKSEFNKLNIIKFLVQNDVNPDEPNNNNQTPIHIACQKQYKNIVEYLIKECEVDINYKDDNGYTSLYYLLVGEIKLYEKKEISDLITFQRKDNIDKKDHIIEIKKKIYKKIKNEPFLESLKKSIHDSYESNLEIQKIRFDMNTKISKLLSSTDKSNLVNQNKELVNIEKNEIKQIIDTLWGKFSNTIRLELGEKTDDSLFFNSENISILQNINIKKEIKKKIKDNMLEFKQNFDSFIDNNISDYEFDTNDIISNIYTVFANNSNNIKINHIHINNTDYYYVPDKDNDYYIYDPYIDFNDNDTFTNINQVHISPNAYDFADNIIDLESMEFYGGSRNLNFYDSTARVLYAGLFDINTDKNLFEYELDVELKFIKLFIYLLDIDNIDNYKNLNNEDLNNYLKILPYPKDQARYNYVITYYNKLFNPIYYREIYCEFLKIHTDPNNNLNLDLEIDKITFFSCLFNKHCTFDNYIAYYTFYSCYNNFRGLLNIDENNNIRFLKVIFINFIDPFNTITIVDAQTDNFTKLTDKGKQLQQNINNVFNYIENGDIEKLINELYKLDNENKIYVPNITICDFIYMVKNKKDLNFFFFDKYYDNTINNYDDIIQEIESRYAAQYQQNFDIIDFDDYKLIMKIIFNCIPPSFQNFLYCLIDCDINDNNLKSIYYNKFIEAFHLKLIFRGMIPIFSLPEKDINNNFELEYEFQSNNRNNKRKIIIYDYNYQLNQQNPSNYQNVALNLPQNPSKTPLPLPFNYFNITQPLINIDKNNYLYIKNQYRPPTVASFIHLQISHTQKILNILNEIIKKNGYSYYALFYSIENGRLKDISKYYFYFYYIIYILSNIQNNLITKIEMLSSISLTRFDMELFNKKLNSINANIFLYFYLSSSKNKLRIPKFSYFNVDFNKSYLFNNINNKIIYPEKISLARLSLKRKTDSINNKKASLGNNKPEHFISYLQNILLDESIINKMNYYQYKSDQLPPSLISELSNFFEYNKIELFKKIFVTRSLYKSILDNIGNLLDNLKISNMQNKESQKMFYLFKLVEEIIKDHAELYKEQILNTTLSDNQLFDIGEFRNISIETILEKTNVNFIKNIDIYKNLYFFKNKDKNEECKFIIYPNEYNNTNVLKLMYCLKINQDILKLLLDNDCDCYLIDNDNNSIISPLEKTFHYESIITIKNNKIDLNNFELPKNPVDQLKKISNNHINKLINGSNYINYIKYFTGSQYNEIKEILLSNNKFGYNIINYLDTSFKTLFYIVNEYLTDNLYCFDNDFNSNDLIDIYKITTNDKQNITKHFLIDIINKNKSIHKIPIDNKTIILKDYLNQLQAQQSKNDNIIMKINKEILEKKKMFTSSKHNHNTQLIIDLKHMETKNKELNTLSLNIKSNLTTLYFEFKHNLSKYTEPNKLIDYYKDITTHETYGVYLECWEYLFTNDLSKSWNLDLIKILLREKTLLDSKSTLNIIEYETITKFYKKVSSLGFTYFEESKFTDSNEVHKFVFDLIEHLTATYICFNIEMILRNLLVKYYTDLSTDENFIEINKKINYLLVDCKNIIADKSFIDILYTDIPKDLVKNSIDIFHNLEDKQTFESRSIKEILNELFNLLTVGENINIPANSYFMQILNNELSDYFDLFIQKLINNWLVVIQNIFKFTINQYRISKSILELVK
jgi:hypothetical protein